MPWYAYDRTRPGNDGLAKVCGVASIPSLTLLDTDGSVLTHRAADLLQQHPSGDGWPYRPRPIQEASEADAAIINSARCCICFVDGGEAQRKSAEKVLSAAAEAEFAKPREARSLLFFLADVQDPFAHRLMSVRPLPPPHMHMLFRVQCWVSFADCKDAQGTLVEKILSAASGPESASLFFFLACVQDPFVNRLMLVSSRSLWCSWCLCI